MHPFMVGIIFVLGAISVDWLPPKQTFSIQPAYKRQDEMHVTITEVQTKYAWRDGREKRDLNQWSNDAEFERTWHPYYEIAAEGKNVLVHLCLWADSVSFQPAQGQRITVIPIRTGTTPYLIVLDSERPLF